MYSGGVEHGYATGRRMSGPRNRATGSRTIRSTIGNEIAAEAAEPAVEDEVEFIQVEKDWWRCKEGTTRKMKLRIWMALVMLALTACTRATPAPEPTEATVPTAVATPAATATAMATATTLVALAEDLEEQFSAGA